MADFTTYANGDVVSLSGGANAASLPAFTVYENTYDVARGTVTAADVCTQFLKIPAGSMVLGVQVHVVEVCNASATLSVGDATDPDGYAVAVDLATAGRTAGAGAYVAADTDTTALQIPQHYTADTWIQFTVNTANITFGKFTVSVAVANLG